MSFPGSFGRLLVAACVLLGTPFGAAPLADPPDTAYNLDLSQRRASAVAHALKQRFGIRAAQLSVQGFGFSRPLKTNATEAGRARTRRVELARHC